MAISIGDIKIGGLHLAGNEQKRRITQIEEGHVWYESRSHILKNEWSYGHPKNNPPSLESFAADCYQLLTPN